MLISLSLAVCIISLFFSGAFNPRTFHTNKAIFEARDGSLVVSVHRWPTMPTILVAGVAYGVEIFPLLRSGLCIVITNGRFNDAPTDLLRSSGRHDLFL